MSKPKYEKGRPITDIHDLIDIMDTQGVVYWRDKVQTKGWLGGMQLNTLRNMHPAFVAMKRDDHGR